MVSVDNYEMVLVVGYDVVGGLCVIVRQIWWYDDNYEMVLVAGYVWRLMAVCICAL